MSVIVDPAIFKAYDVRAIYPTPDQRRGRAPGGPRLHRLPRRRTQAHRRGPRRAPLVARDRGRLHRGRAQRGGGDHRHRRGGDGHAVLPRRRARTSTAAPSSPPPTIPKEYNGIKMVRRGALALSGDAGIKEIKEAITRRPLRRQGRRGPARSSTRTISDDYAEHCLSFIDVAKVPPHQGRARHRQRHGRGRGQRDLQAPARSSSSRCTSTSTAPSPTTRRIPSRRRTAARSWSAWPRRRRRLGIAWDGDADRCFFIDDTGAVRPRRLRDRAPRRVLRAARSPGAQGRLRRARLARRARPRGGRGRQSPS